MKINIQVGWKDSHGKLHGALLEGDSDFIPSVSDKVEFALPQEMTLTNDKTTGYGHVSSRTFTLGNYSKVLLWLEDVDLK